MTTFETITKILSVQLGFERSTITEQTKLASLDVDSLDRIELCMELEDEFAIVLPDDLGPGIDTVGDIVALVEKHKAAEESVVHIVGQQ